MATAQFDLLQELNEVSKRAVAAPLDVERGGDQRELEDVLAFVNFYLSRIDRYCEGMGESRTNKAASFDWDDSRQVSTLYRDWLDVAQVIARALNGFQAAHGPIQYAEDFQANLQRVSLMSLDTDRTKRSIESLESGRGIPFDRAMDQLRDKLR